MIYWKISLFSARLGFLEASLGLPLCKITVVLVHSMLFVRSSCSWCLVRSLLPGLLEHQQVSALCKLLPITTLRSYYLTPSGSHTDRRSLVFKGAPQYTRRSLLFSSLSFNSTSRAALNCDLFLTPKDGCSLFGPQFPVPQ